MSVPMFISIYSDGTVWVDNVAHRDPKTYRGTAGATGTLVTCVRVNSDATHQKITTLTGSGNSSSSALAATGGTGATGSRHTQAELT